jgi:hypothetical protein
MKKFLLILIVALAGLTTTAQDAAPLINALRSGSADQVSNYFDKMLDLKFPEKEEIKSMGKNQASIALRSFYNDNNINGFEVLSQREMSGTMYIAGKLTNGGEGIKLSMMIRYREGRPHIITVRIG